MCLVGYLKKYVLVWTDRLISEVAFQTVPMFP